MRMVAHFRTTAPSAKLSLPAPIQQADGRETPRPSPTALCAQSGHRWSAFRGRSALVAWQTLHIAWILLLHSGVTC